MKHSTEYLYDCKPSEFSQLSYTEALKFKRDMAKQLILELMQVHYIDRDDQRIKAVFSAIKFNQSLIDELKS